MLFPLHQIPTALQFPDGNTRWLLNAIVCLVLVPVDRIRAAYPWNPNFSFTDQPIMKESNPFWHCGRWFIRWKLQGCPCSPKYYALKVLCISFGTGISFGRLSDQYIRPAKDLAAKIRGNVLYLCHNDQPRHSRSMHIWHPKLQYTLHKQPKAIYDRESWPGKENLISYQGIVTLDKADNEM